MHIHRFPLSVGGVLTAEALAVLGRADGRAGRSYSVSFLVEGAQVVRSIDLLGEHLFVPADIPAGVVADVEACLAPMAEGEEGARRAFFAEVLRPGLAR